MNNPVIETLGSFRAAGLLTQEQTENAIAAITGNHGREVMTRIDFATAAKVSTRTIDRWLRNGTIRGSRIGGAVRIRATELDRVLSEVDS